MSVVGKKVKIVFDDGEKVNYRDGMLISQSELFFELRTDKGTELIPVARVVRIEVLG